MTPYRSDANLQAFCKDAKKYARQGVFLKKIKFFAA